MGGILQAGASLLGASMGADAASDAAATQAAAADRATAAQEKQYQQTRSDMLPFYNTGIGANRQLGYLLGINQADINAEQGKGAGVDPYANINKDLGGFGSLAKSFSMSDYQADPGYAFRLAEGQKALERSAAARGMTASGAAMKAAQQYGQNLASDEYQNAFNRYNANQTNLFNRLSGVSGTGQTTANTLATTGQNTANQIGSNIIGAGNAQAAGQIGSANAWSTGINNATKSLTGDNGLSSGISSIFKYFGG